MSVSWKTPITTKGAIFPRMSSMRVTGVTWSCSSVPRSLSRTIAIAVNWMSVNVRMIAMRPGMMNVAVRRSGLYQGLTRTSTGSAGVFQPARCARRWIDRPFAIPLAIDIACDEVVVSDAFTMRSACAGAPRWMSLPKFASITRPTDACAESISRRSSACESTYLTTSKYSLAVIFETSSRLSYERDSSRTAVVRCLTS